ncbi:MAG: carboxypeptidase-like regulatory domain-containing protein [Gammaproteobacteria bacterium]|nr:carboxypeptidase-like regulatory domain-containing protein [Gammaproteobacteria bacterium]MDD9895076.1 carboxypeptidase-like regulatory domain-containing protein [Gammaproteobacteria bacterium]
MRFFTALISIVLISSLSLRVTAQDQNTGVISGTVQSQNGPEAGVWVIAETDDTPTHFTKIVVTDDAGRFVLPELPEAIFQVWVRGYGLVDSEPTSLRAGATNVSLKAFVAGDPLLAAQVYPANYWYSLLEVPGHEEFPGTGPDGNGISTGMRSQAQWIDMTKQGCQLCHQLGNKLTRSLDHLSHLGFETSLEAWQYRTAMGIRGPFMAAFAGRYGPRGMEMYADWTDRIAAGEVPPAPPRPSGVERNIVITQWDWGNESSYIHDEITTDKRDPTINAGGLVYGVDGGHGSLLELDTETHEWREIVIEVFDNPDNPAVTRFAQQFPVPSVFYGDEPLWQRPADPHNPMFDELGRVWMTTKVRGDIVPEWCQEGSDNKFAQYYPTSRSTRQASYYDPATEDFGLIDTCFGTHHLQFGFTDDRMLYFSGGGDVIGWINTRLWDETQDEKLSQGWCPMVVDTNGDGVITKPWNQPVGALRSQNEGGGGEQLVDFDPTLDTRMSPGSYGIIVDPVSNVAWGAGTEFPGRIYRMDIGANPPETCITEVYELPVIDGQINAFGPRGLDVDKNGIVWTALSGSSHLASFDRSKCEVMNGPTVIDSQHCPEGWTFYESPGPRLKGTTVKADFHYYNWIDNYNALGLGENVPIATGSGSDSLKVLDPETGEWVVMRVPYPLGFYSRGLDGRIDDINGGWKGRAVWANYGTNFNWHTEGGKGTTSKMVKFQIRPDPLAE